MNNSLLVLITLLNSKGVWYWKEKKNPSYLKALFGCVVAATQPLNQCHTKAVGHTGQGWGFKVQTPLLIHTLYWSCVLVLSASSLAGYCRKLSIKRKERKVGGLTLLWRLSKASWGLAIQITTISVILCAEGVQTWVREKLEADGNVSRSENLLKIFTQGLVFSLLSFVLKTPLPTKAKC